MKYLTQSKSLAILIMVFFVYFNSKADCTTCDHTLNSNSNNYTFAAGTTCVEGTPILENAVTFASGASICVTSGATLSLNNVNTFTFGDPNTTVTLDISGTLRVNGSSTWVGNMNIFVHSGGILEMANQTLTLNGSIMNITNDGTFNVGTMQYQKTGAVITVINNSTMTVGQTLNVTTGSAYYKNNGTLTVGGNYNSSSSSVYVNCGSFNGKFNLNGGAVANTGTFTSSQIDFGNSSAKIENYGLFLCTGSINASGKIYNEGIFTLSSGAQLSGDGDLAGPTDSSKKGYFVWSGKNGKNHGTIGPNLDFINSNGTSNFATMFNGNLSGYTWISPNYFQGDAGWTSTLPTLPVTTCPNADGTPATPVPAATKACTPANLANLQPTESNVTYEWWTGNSTTRTAQITGSSLSNYTAAGTVYLWARSVANTSTYSPSGAAVTVLACNTPPVANDDAYKTTSNGNPIPLTPASNDTDADHNVLTVVSINGITVVSGTSQAISVTGGKVNVAIDGTIAFTPTARYHGTITFPYSISDGNGGTSTANITITVYASCLISNRMVTTKLL